MPSIGFGEIIVIVLVALIVFGPRKLPEIGRSVGKSLREFRRATSELRSEIETDLDEEPPAPSAWDKAQQGRRADPREEGRPEDEGGITSPDPSAPEEPAPTDGKGPAGERGTA